MNLTDVLQELADQADTILELNVYSYSVEKPEGPAFVISLPERIDFDATYGRGSDRMTIPAWVLVGRSSDHSSAVAIAEYVNGSGARSIKQVLQAGAYTAFDVVTVKAVEGFDFISWGGANFLAAQFSLDVIGSGS